MIEGKLVKEKNDLMKRLKEVNLKMEVELLNEMRKAGVGMTFAAHIKQKHRATVAQLYVALGINPLKHTFGDLWAGPEQIRWIAPEFIRDCFLDGMRRQQYEKFVFAAETQSDSKVQEFPTVDFSTMTKDTAKRRTPGASFKMHEFDVRSKFVSTQEFGTEIRFPYKFNTIRRVKLNIVPIYFQAFGTQLGRMIWLKALNVLTTGDGGVDNIDPGNRQTVVETPLKIGVATVGEIVEDDFLRVIVEMNAAGKPCTTMIADTKEVMAALKWECFKRQAASPEEIKAELVTPFPTQVSIIPTTDATDMILMNKSMALIKFVYQNLVVEAEKIISKRLEDAVATIDLGVALMHRGARVIIDKTLEFNENQFKDWFYYG
jgi:hypothetical protein